MLSAVRVGAAMAMMCGRVHQKGPSPAGAAASRRRRLTARRKVATFLPLQLRKNKDTRGSEARCRKPPGGKPVILTEEPKWWNERRQRRHKSVRGRKGSALPPHDLAKARSRTCTQATAIRREQLLLDTYATDRICECRIVLSPFSMLDFTCRRAFKHAQHVCASPRLGAGSSAAGDGARACGR